MKKIDKHLLEELTLKAKESPRKRAHYNLHSDLNESVHRLCIAVEQGSYVRPHRHKTPEKTELLILLSGKLAVLKFDDAGKVLERIEMDETNINKAVEIDSNEWHTFVSLQSGTFVMEVKQGPYIKPIKEDFASWAPEEGEELAPKFEQWYRIAKEGESFSSFCNSGKEINIVIETEMGNIEVSLYPDKAPITCANFLRYMDNRYYKNSQFYRTVKMDNQPDKNIKIEVIQGGLDSSYEKTIYSPIKLERTNITGLSHKNGTISMARAKGPDSATSEFFICINDQPELDFGGRRNPDGQGFAAFGQVTKGMDIVRKIQQQKDTNQRIDLPIKIININKK